MPSSINIRGSAVLNNNDENKSRTGSRASLFTVSSRRSSIVSTVPSLSGSYFDDSSSGVCEADEEEQLDNASVAASELISYENIGELGDSEGSERADASSVLNGLEFDMKNEHITAPDYYAKSDCSVYENQSLNTIYTVENTICSDIESICMRTSASITNETEQDDDCYEDIKLPYFPKYEAAEAVAPYSVKDLQRVNDCTLEESDSAAEECGGSNNNDGGTQEEGETFPPIDVSELCISDSNGRDMKEECAHRTSQQSKQLKIFRLRDLADNSKKGAFKIFPVNDRPDINSYEDFPSLH